LKVFIAVDMEGATGITSWDDVIRGKPSYNQSRLPLTTDVNAAIEGALEAGATEILVNDSHARMRNLILDKLNPKARVIRGNKGKKLVMMEGINESFDKVFLVGFHARAGTMAAILNHTFTFGIQNFWINNVLVGEGGVSAALAGHFGVPVSLVTGDDKVIKEISELVPDVVGAEVKKGISKYSADCLSQDVSYRLIKEASKEAMSREVQPYIVDSPVNMMVEFTSSEMGHAASWIPSVELVEARKISCIADNVIDAWINMWAAILLASNADQRI
jgi:D-amino peptidase